MKIVFMGTPAFAVPSLKILVDNGYDVVGVVTSTDKYGGRGKKRLLESAVKKYAYQEGLNILQPPRLKRSDFVEQLHSLQADLQVIVAFRMLPEVVWNMPPLGSINLHASLLPRYRGAAPINWAVIKGDSETGLTTFKLKHAIDTGDLIHQRKVSILPNETAGELHDKMMPIGAKLVLQTVRDIEVGNVVEYAQDNNLVSHAPKIFHEDCAIRFDRSAQEVHNFIRGLSPHPGAWAKLDGGQLNIIRSELTNRVVRTGHEPGSLELGTKGEFSVACRDKYINLLEVQMAGRRRMDAAAFLNGYTPQFPALT